MIYMGDMGDLMEDEALRRIDCEERGVCPLCGSKLVTFKGKTYCPCWRD